MHLFGLQSFLNFSIVSFSWWCSVNSLFASLLCVAVIGILLVSVCVVVLCVVRIHLVLGFFVVLGVFVGCNGVWSVWLEVQWVFRGDWVLWGAGVYNDYTWASVCDIVHVLVCTHVCVWQSVCDITSCICIWSVVTYVDTLVPWAGCISHMNSLGAQ